ncbi:MAG TPA: lipopolysaccharide heptosyltransferase II [Pyrinomonadaceae bacterium]
MPNLRVENLRRVLVRGTNWVGDAVMTVPALRELRRLLPAAHITLATRTWAKGLFANAEFIDDLLTFESGGLLATGRQISQWRARKFDLALLFPNSFESALVAAVARVPIRIGYSTESRGFLLTNPVPLPEWRSSRHEVYYYLRLVDELGRLLNLSKIGVAPDTSLQVSPVRTSQAIELLRAKGVNSGHAVIAFCPGSINSRAKRWPAERYAELGDRLIEQLDATVLLIGSAAELDVSVEVSTRMKHKPVMLTGQTQLDELVALLTQVDLLITNDTGPAHIAAALRRPTLVIFGPTNPLTTRPFSTSAEIMREPPDCAPCMLRDCPIDHRCMTAISPDQVFEKARMLISDKLQLVVGARANLG